MEKEALSQQDIENIKRDLSEKLQQVAPSAQSTPDNEHQKFAALGLSLPASLWAPFVSMLVDKIVEIVKAYLDKQQKG